jgi:hypothetical protein
MRSLPCLYGSSLHDTRCMARRQNSTAPSSRSREVLVGGSLTMKSQRSYRHAARGANGQVRGHVRLLCRVGVPHACLNGMTRVRALAAVAAWAEDRLGT